MPVLLVTHDTADAEAAAGTVLVLRTDAMGSAFIARTGAERSASAVSVPGLGSVVQGGGQ